MSERREELYPPAVEAYWEAADDRRLVVPVCEDCGETFFPPRAACPYCLSRDLSHRESAGTGEVYSYSVVRVDGHPTMGDRAPYVVALVALDDGPTVFSTVTDCAVSEVSVGMDLAVDFERLDGDQLYPVFAPAE